MRYILEFVRRSGKTDTIDAPIEADGIGQAIDIVTDTEGYHETFGHLGSKIVIADDRKSATITNRMGRLVITEIPTRMFRVDTSDMPTAKRGNPTIDCEEESIDDVITMSVAAALQAGFKYHQITIKKSPDGRSATMHETVHGSMMKIVELNKYMVDLVEQGNRRAGVGPFWALNVREVIGLVGDNDPTMHSIDLWWDVEDDNAVLRHKASDYPITIKIVRER